MLDEEEKDGRKKREGKGTERQHKKDDGEEREGEGKLRIEK